MTRILARRVLFALLVASAIGVTLGASQAAERRGFIWSFERSGRSGWLAGSLHMLTADAYPLPQTMESAFKQADVLVEEIDLAESADPRFAASVLAKAMYQDGSTLGSRLSKDTLKVLAGWASRNGMDLALFQQFKPWMVALTVQTLALQRVGFDAALGLDKHFEEAARKAGKPILPLETAADQIDFLDTLSATTQDQMLRESVETADSEQAEVKAIAAAWKSGDAAAVERIALAGMKDAPEVHKALLTDRNRRWIPKLEQCVQTRRCFTVVGAAHLVGPDGLIALLQQRGFTLRQQ